MRNDIRDDVTVADDLEVEAPTAGLHAPASDLLICCISLLVVTGSAGSKVEVQPV